MSNFNELFIKQNFVFSNKKCEHPNITMYVHEVNKMLWELSVQVKRIRKENKLFGIPAKREGLQAGTLEEPTRIVLNVLFYPLGGLIKILFFFYLLVLLCY